ncbi:MAG: phosphoenolpyruvate carboxykinase (ATP) [Cyclobacteriaceae bacterium]
MTKTTNLLPIGSPVHYNLTSAELVEETIKKGQGVLNDTGALLIDTGKFTGRSPQDRFIVRDEITEDAVWWGPVNKSFEPAKFDALEAKIMDYMKDKELYVRDAFVCADEDYKMSLRVYNTLPWQNMFCYNMFLRPSAEELKDFDAEFTILCAPGFEAVPDVDGTRQSNFAILNMTKKMIIIGGTAYTGEMKKGIFSALNFILPHQKNVLSMHCSANIGQKGDSAVFFGLSGTGKTTLSADPDRKLIGDDEHGWAEDHIFNFEGGCYAKAIDLSKEKEPDIWDAVKFEAIVENTRFYPGTRTIDYTNSSVTENTRVSYPIYHINNAVEPSVGAIPNNIFFLTCDAFGVLPPISKLDKGQAMYHFISGYTAKVAGTEAGITEPVMAFSACFGAPFMPLHPTAYAEMLGKKMDEGHVNVWLVNTGWSGGPYGVGKRLKLQYTRAMITAALDGELNNVGYRKHTIFGVNFPSSCPGVPAKVLSAKATWTDDDDYYEKANKLARAFNDNFKKFEDYANDEIMTGAPTPND